ncbi:hypothetical protein [Paraburkholderia phenoliruptrix]|uniref:hypothetical protein n=1 Tax=Paraburkholderia phenoliruptrix TaxID=252970 RepID=UPI0034CD8DAA
MTPQSFRQLLEELDPRVAAQYSTINHHVDGMQYLCLHRSPRLTVKLYLIDPALIDRQPGEFLVTPHTHRYAFESTVLAGSLDHVRFVESSAHDDGEAYDRFVYLPETRARLEAGSTRLAVRERHTYGVGASYWNDVRDIHTLAISDRLTVLGLTQFADTERNSIVYVKPGAEMKYPAAHTPTTAPTDLMRRLALDAMDRNG